MVDLGGSRIGPRVAQLVNQAMLDAKQKGLPTDQKLMVATFNDILHFLGKESATLYESAAKTLLDDPELPPNLRRQVESLMAAEKQWTAIIAVLAAPAGAIWAFQQLGMLEFQEFVQRITGKSPKGHMDPGSAVAAYTSRHISKSTYELIMAESNIKVHEANWVAESAFLKPDAGSILDMLNRDLITASEAYNLLRESGYKEDVIAAMLISRRMELTPDQAAQAVLFGTIPEAEGRQIAEKSGMSNDDFHVLVESNGQPPALSDLLSLWRRNIIDDATLDKAIRQGPVRNEWIPVIKQLGIIPPSPDEVLDALLEGQIEEGEARRRFEEAGGDPTWFQDAFNARGTAPTPVQAADMANRGIIPWSGKGPEATSFEQAFLEGPWRNKWTDAFRRSAEWIPSPENISALYRRNAIDRRKAEELFSNWGATPEIVNIMLDEGTKEKLAPQRELAVTTITTLYRDQVITIDDARDLLGKLGYDENEVEFILIIEDLRRAQKFTELAIGRVRTQYVGRKIEEEKAVLALDQIGVPASQREQLLYLWDIERDTKTAELTAAQIKSAWKKKIITIEDALQRLVDMGYSEVDAAIYLQI